MKRIVKNIEGKFELVDFETKKVLCDWFVCSQNCDECIMYNEGLRHYDNNIKITESEAIKIFNECNKK